MVRYLQDWITDNVPVFMSTRIQIIGSTLKSALFWICGRFLNRFVFYKTFGVCSPPQMYKTHFLINCLVISSGFKIHLGLDKQWQVTLRRSLFVVLVKKFTLFVTIFLKFISFSHVSTYYSPFKSQKLCFFWWNSRTNLDSKAFWQDIKTVPG